jgi:hypothetical protein
MRRNIVGLYVFGVSFVVFKIALIVAAAAAG